MNTIEKVRSYKKLLDAGVLSEDEYIEKKNEALREENCYQGDVFELLKGYKSLVDDGLITETDFVEKKESLLQKDFTSSETTRITEEKPQIMEATEKIADKTVQSMSNKISEVPKSEAVGIKKLKSNKKLTIVIGAVIAAVLLIMLIGGSSRLSEAEQHVVNCVKSVSYENTITVSDAYVVYHEYDSGEKVTYAVIAYSGTSSYGSAISGTAVFKDGSYLMDYYDDIPIDGSLSSLDKAVALRDIKLAPSSEIKKVKVTKINKALKKG